jgi:hypothetical protein
MGEVHHPHDAEDQREAYPQERISPSEHEGVQAMLEELGHWESAVGDGSRSNEGIAPSRRREWVGYTHELPLPARGER